MDVRLPFPLPLLPTTPQLTPHPTPAAPPPHHLPKTPRPLPTHPRPHPTPPHPFAHLPRLPFLPLNTHPPLALLLPRAPRRAAANHDLDVFPDVGETT